MRKLSEVRTGWDVIEAEETRLLRAMTIEASLAVYAKLQRAWEPHLRATEAEFRPMRFEYLRALQERLARLEAWKRRTMDQLYESVLQIQKQLQTAGIPSVIIGGIAIGVWGDPRVTRDADIKVLLNRKDAKRLWSLLKDNYQPLQRDPVVSLQTVGFAFFHDANEIRIDVLLADTTFDESAIRRARAVKLSPDAESEALVCSPEDLIVYKMISLRDIDRRDATMLIRRMKDQLDDAYVEKWLREFEQALDDSTLVADYRQLRGK
ncbi:MAG TPA: hypothetical protein VJ020_07230 [Anaerolineales bacterium]|nr:hypothetical protein [Anaerolineales bacterium]